MQFKVGNGKYIIGTKMFPVSNRGSMKIFTSENTEKIDNDTLSDLLDIQEFEIGRCYTNAEKVRLVGEHLGLDVVLYSGWYFPTDDYFPVHHTWCVLNGNVIDVCVKTDTIEIMKNFKSNSEDWRKELAMLLHEADKIKKKARDKYVFGKVLSPAIYVGSPDDYKHAIDIFNKTIKAFPNHPSYKNRGMNAFGASTLQKEILKLQNIGGKKI